LSVGRAYVEISPAVPAQVARCRMHPESVETGLVAYRPVPFLETDGIYHTCTALKKHIGFAAVNGLLAVLC
jgi:hypothetical protein